MQHKKRLVLALALILLSSCIFVSLYHRPVTQSSYILPLSESEVAQQSALIESQLSYVLSDDECFEIVVETWQEGVLVDTIPLRTLDGSEATISISANSAVDENGLVWSSGEQHIKIGLTDFTENATLATVWDVLTLSSFEKIYDKDTFDYTDGIVLICVGFSDSNTGVQAIDCLSVMEDSSFLSRYEYAQVVRVQLIH